MMIVFSWASRVLLNQYGLSGEKEIPVQLAKVHFQIMIAMLFLKFLMKLAGTGDGY
jgi:hypothetical protein